MKITAVLEKGKTMTTKESILLYFSDINYAYNDSTRLDALEKGLAELEEVVRCKDCRHLKQEFQWNGMPYKTCEFHGNGYPDDWYCADGERKADADK